MEKTGKEKGTNHKRKLEEGLEEIYLGNLSTVESNLRLPERTRQGLNIDWHSSDTALLEHDGRIHRPDSKEGNRRVFIRAAVHKGGVAAFKEFEVTILALPRKRAFVRQLPMEFEAAVSTEFQIPGCAMLELEDGMVCLPVKWERGGRVSVAERKIYQVKGILDIHEPQAAAGDDSYEFKYIIENQPKEVTAYVVGTEKEYPDSELPEKKVHGLDGRQVYLTGNDKFSQDAERMVRYLLSFSPDSLLYNFRAAAGMPLGDSAAMRGWDAPESKLRGHTTGHYLSAVALAYEMTGDGRMKQRAEELLDELEKIQKKFTERSKEYEGYLSAYGIEQFEDLESGMSYPGVWAPYYTLHKILAGLLDCYRAFQSEKALLTAVNIGNWVYNRLSVLDKERLDKMWSLYIAGEFGGMNESLAELAIITGNEKFLKAARMFDNDTLFYPMLRKVDVLGGIHANQHIPQIIGALKLFEATGEGRFLEIADNFWEIVQKHHIYAIGGIGNTELFQNPDCIGSELSEKNAESCCSYNMLKLTKKLFEYKPSVKYADYYERVLLNHILANSCMEHGGKTTYFMGMQPGAKKNYALVDNTCCHGTGLESKFRYGEGIYYEYEEGVYINLFINSGFKTQAGFALEQSVENMERSRIRITVKESDEKERTVKIRIPIWCGGKYEIFCPFGKEKICEENGYIAVRGGWRADDEIRVDFHCFFKMEHPKDRPELFTVSYGPFILALLDDKKDFIEFPQSEEVLLKEIKKQEGLTFSMNGYHLKPLYQVIDEGYHIYMKSSGLQTVLETPLS